VELQRGVSQPNNNGGDVGISRPNPTEEVAVPTPTEQDVTTDDTTSPWRVVTISLQRHSLNDFTLRNRGFNWVQEEPFVG
jgi:hypothetical protein